MTTLPHAQHMARKKGYTPHYSPAHINLFQPEIHDYSLELLEVGVFLRPLVVLAHLHHPDL
jgi:hypothetical protein